MIKDIVIAIRSYRHAHSFIRNHRLWKWIVIPGIIYMLMFCISMYFFSKSASRVIDWLSVETGVRQWIESMQSDVIDILFSIVGILLWLILMLFYFSLFKYIWLILGSPVFAYLSEKTDSLLKGKSAPFNLSQLIHDIIRGSGIALRNTLWQTFYLIAFFILSFIPVIGFVIPVFALLLECYYFGFSMLDYSCERQQLSARESIRFIKNRKGLAIGNGLLFYLLHLIPVIGWLVAPSYAVIAATISVMKITTE